VSLASLLVLTMCHSHVQLDAPQAEAPLGARVRAYESLAPAKGWDLVLRDDPDLLLLGRGSSVYFPTDLLPVVASGSRTAQAARDWESADRTSTIFTTVGGVLVVPGTIGVFAGMLMGLASLNGGDSGEGGTILAVSGVGLLVGLVAVGIGVRFDGAADEAKASAFANYREGLRQRLALCPEGDDLGVCGP